MSGCFGCAAWARAHASGRGVQSPDFTPTLRAVVFAGGSAALRRLWIAELSTAHRALHPIPQRLLRDPWEIVNSCLTFVINERMGAGSAIVPCSILEQDASLPDTKYTNRSAKPHEMR